MLKKWIVTVLCVMLAVMPVCKAETVPGDAFFLRGKDALSLLASGKIDEALALLSFSFKQKDQSTENFRAFLKEYLPTLKAETVQRNVAVCYWEEVSRQFLLAIPISEPKTDDVMNLVLFTDDFETFTGYAALSWAEVTEGTAASQYVWWNTEYATGAGALYAD